MAAFREHVSVSAMLGFGYGFVSSITFGYTFVQGVLAGCLTGVAGMLPDLDSSSGRPIREIFGLVGAVAPLLIVNHVVKWLDLPGDPETIMLVIVLLYVAIKYGGAAIVGRLSVHRGMFHSIPALVIAAEVVYLSYPTAEMRVKLLMSIGVAIGFFSHLLLDEIYSVDINATHVKLKKSFGTAIKMVGEEFGPNVFTYTLMATLTYATLSDVGWLEQRTAPDGTRANVASPTEATPSVGADSSLGQPGTTNSTARHVMGGQPTMDFGVPGTPPPAFPSSAGFAVPPYPEFESKSGAFGPDTLNPSSTPAPWQSASPTSDFRAR